MRMTLWGDKHRCFRWFLTVVADLKLTKVCLSSDHQAFSTLDWGARSPATGKLKPWGLFLCYKAAPHVSSFLTYVSTNRIAFKMSAELMWGKKKNRAKWGGCGSWDIWWVFEACVHVHVSNWHTDGSSVVMSSWGVLKTQQLCPRRSLALIKPITPPPPQLQKLPNWGH